MMMHKSRSHERLFSCIREDCYVTVTVVEAVTVPDVAVTVAVPRETPVINPVLVMPTTFAFEVVQVTDVVTSRVVPSDNVAVAVICCVCPVKRLGFAGAIVRVVITWLLTVMVVEPVTPPEAAEIVVVPIATAVARPAASMVATAVLEELQVAVEVIS